MNAGDISDALVEENGVWVSRRTRAVPYLEGGHREYAQVEDESFWFRHRNRVICSVTRRYPPDGAILDVGGGNGYVAMGLQQAGFEVWLLEPGADGAAVARSRGIAHVIRSSFEDAELRDASVPAASMFDVVEHIEDDVGFLRELRRVMKPGGRLYLAVPTYQWLWSHEDVIAHHCRRYTQRSLADVCARAGFEVEYATYFFSFLPPPIFLLRTVPHLLGRSANRGGEGIARDHAHRGARRRVLDAVLASELRVIERGSSIPFGSSCVLVARRTG
jgi:SAM-dependent methyltransferase